MGAEGSIAEARELIKAGPTHCTTLHHTATHCNTLQHIEKAQNTSKQVSKGIRPF